MWNLLGEPFRHGHINNRRHVCTLIYNPHHHTPLPHCCDYKYEFSLDRLVLITPKCVENNHICINKIIKISSNWQPAGKEKNIKPKEKNPLVSAEREREEIVLSKQIKPTNQPTSHKTGWWWWMRRDINTKTRI